MPDIRKVLIANRGEIAVRIIRSCRDLNIATVVVYSEPDETAPHVILADESVFIGNAPSSESYLVMEKIIEAARETGADAVHPGYGFLSENAAFARLCQQNNLIFIGPSSDSIDIMGDKTRARQTMDNAGVASPPGTVDALESVEEAEKVAGEIGYPVLIKAAAGGGGKGMRIVHEKGDLKNSVTAAQSEAKNAFGDGRVYIEKYLESPRHVEFQIIGDHEGKIFHLFDRECSIQRRHQKVIEEAPCSFLTPKLRADMANAAITVAKTCNYTNAGTVEFLVDKHNNFYFLEVNTRLQVEHPVTELVTGLDLVALQIQVAEQKPLDIVQEDLQINGHAIECRISAEDPAENFLPSTGKLNTHIIPSGPGIRVDSGVREGQEISIHYDPLISKLITHGKDRKQAIQRMDRALQEYEIAGVKTTIPFCRYVMNHSAFTDSKYDTHFVGDHFAPSQLDLSEDDAEHEIAAIGAALVMAVSDGSDGSHEQTTVAVNESEWWSKRGKRN
ncbi:MAG: acetyl-CoA carboxylase biotin carboxylase subunit [Balneolales bacterium]